MKVVLACNGTRGIASHRWPWAATLRSEGTTCASPCLRISVAWPRRLACRPHPTARTPRTAGMPSSCARPAESYCESCGRSDARSRSCRRCGQPILQYWLEMSTTLEPLAKGRLAVHRIVLPRGRGQCRRGHGHPTRHAALFSGQPQWARLPIGPPQLSRLAMTVYDWFGWRMYRRVENRQRSTLGLPPAAQPNSRRVSPLRRRSR
jgi:hypothetical protein